MELLFQPKYKLKFADIYSFMGLKIRWRKNMLKTSLYVYTVQPCMNHNSEKNEMPFTSSSVQTPAVGRGGDQKLNSWTYNFIGVSGYSLERSQSWGFCMDFLNHREGGIVFFYIRFPPFSFTETQRGCVSLKKKYKFQGKAEEVTVNSKEENS